MQNRPPRSGDYCPGCHDHDHWSAKDGRGQKVSGRSKAGVGGLLAVGAALLALSGGGGESSGTDKGPLPQSTICNEYFKGGC